MAFTGFGRMFRAFVACSLTNSCVKYTLLGCKISRILVFFLTRPACTYSTCLLVLCQAALTFEGIFATVAALVQMVQHSAYCVKGYWEKLWQDLGFGKLVCFFDKIQY